MVKEIFRTERFVFFKMKLTNITESNWFSKVLLHKPDWPEVGKIETKFNLIESEMMTIKMCVDVLFR